jgi:carbon-monoxide dehydrogenase small subunit
VSCVALGVDADGRSVETVEGISEGDHLHPLQERFLELSAFQCGYCAPGFVMSAKALLAENPDPTEQQIREAIAGNLCRCTAYVGIVKAIGEVAAARRD